MIQLHPGESFKIIRLLNDPADSGTYYVRAVVRRSDDNTVLETINLTDQGSRRFTGEWEVTSNIGANGSYVDITTTVYTDSGYTTTSGDYAEENTTFLVQERLTRTELPAGGGDISAKKLREIVKEEVANRDRQEMPSLDLSNIEAVLGAIADRVNSLPEPKEVEFEPILGRMTEVEGALKEAIDMKPVTKEVDIDAVIRSNTEDNGRAIEEVKRALGALYQAVEENGQMVQKFIAETQNKFDMTGKLRTMLKGGGIDPDKFIESMPVDEEEPKKKRLFLNK